MSIVYYIGGPRGLQKVALPGKPQGNLEVYREALPPYGVHPNGMVSCRDHRYTLRPLVRDVFVALHESVIR